MTTPKEIFARISSSRIIIQRIGAVWLFVASLYLIRRYAGTILLLGLLLLVSLYTATQSRYFLTERNLGNLTIEVVPLALVAIGQMAVILVGGVELSGGPATGALLLVAVGLYSINEFVKRR